MALGQASPKVNDWKDVEPGDWQDVTSAPTPSPNLPQVSLGQNIKEKIGALNQQWNEGPIFPEGQGLVAGAKRIGGELKQAFQGVKEGNPYAAMAHGIQAIPFVGSGIQEGTEAMPPYKDTIEGMDKAIMTPGVLKPAMRVATEVGPIALGGLDVAAPNRPTLTASSLGIPTRAHAGGVLQDIGTQAANVPITPTRTLPEVQRFQELTQRGGRSSKPMTQLAKRLDPANTPQQPMNFPEGRDFYTNVGDVAHATPLQKVMGRGLKPTMRRQAVNVRQGLNEDLTNAAQTIGRGEDYTKAMKEYSNASKLRKAMIGGGLVLGAEALRRSPVGNTAGKLARTLVGGQ